MLESLGHKVRGFFAKIRPVTGMAIDLGTGNTLVSVRGRGVVLDEPTVCAVDRVTRDIVAVGREAKLMLGKTHGAVEAIRPLKDGVIADVEVSEHMLRHFIKKAAEGRSIFGLRHRMIIGVPSCVTEMEKRAIRQSATAAGVGQVFLLAEPMAAAIGVGLPVHSPTGSMILDIGAGTAEIAVIALGGIVSNASIRVGGDEIDEAIITHVRKVHNLLIGHPTAERVKIEIASAFPQEEEKTMEVKGRDLVSGIPVTAVLTSEEVRECIAEAIGQIVAAVRKALEVTPPELAADISDNGIILTGGGALIAGLDRRLAKETGLPIHVDESPLSCVVRGTIKTLEEFERYQDVCMD